jgi:hypothetical protein
VAVTPELVAAAELVFVGEVVELGRSPAAWSGVGRAEQRVRYTVQDVLKGSFAEPAIDVQHAVLEGAPNADPAQPGLDRNFFAVGARLIVFARNELDPSDHDRQRRRWQDFDSTNGVLPFDQATVDEVRRLA